MGSDATGRASSFSQQLPEIDEPRGSPGVSRGQGDVCTCGGGSYRQSCVGGNIFGELGRIPMEKNSPHEPESLGKRGAPRRP